MKYKPPPGLVQTPERLFSRAKRQASFMLVTVNRLYLFQFLVCILIIQVHLLILSTEYFKRVEYLVLDNFYKRRPAIMVDPSIAFIEIAEDSIQGIGRWPWRRQYHAVMTHILTKWKAKAIVFDMIFSEPDTDFDDGALEQAIQESGEVFLPVILERYKNSKKKWIHSLPRFEAHAKGVGHINIITSRDGTLRRISPYLKYNDEIHPHLAMEVAFNAMGMPVPEPEEFTLPLDPKAEFLINWAGKWRHTFEHYSYVDILRSFEAVEHGKQPIINPEKLRGKICIIGLTATGHADIKASPLEAMYPAVGVHANVINGILTRQFIKPAGAYNEFVLMGIGLLSAFVLIPFRNGFSPIASLLLSLFWAGISFIVFSQTGFWFMTVQPILLILSLFIFSVIYSLVLAKKERSYLFDLATLDGLTNLYVIRYVRSVLNQAVRIAQKRREPLSLILIDIDYFKKINDTYGHQAGDMVLKETARLIQLCVRAKRPVGEEDCVGRYGGEEFIVMLRNTSLTDAAFTVAERMRKSIEEAKFLWDDKTIPVTISLGVATLKPGESVPDLMVRRADEALYRAKEEGRNRVCLESSKS